MLLFIVFVGCEQIEKATDEGIPNTEVIPEVIDESLGVVIKVIDSTLYFENADDVFLAMDKLKELNNDERINWERTIGFESMKSIVEELQNKAADLEGEELLNFINSNKAFVRKRDDIEGILCSVLPHDYNFIVGRRGSFVTSEFFSKIQNDSIMTCNVKDYYSVFCLLNNIVSDSDEERISKISILNDNMYDKSYHEVSYGTSSINATIDNYNSNPPTQKGLFSFKLKNTYIPAYVSDIVTTTDYYFEVRYNCCSDEVSQYFYYSPALGGLQFFEQIGYNEYRIKVPVENYFELYEPEFFYMTGSAPKWVSSTYEKDMKTVRWHTYKGEVNLVRKYELWERKNRWAKWKHADESWGTITNTVASVQIGSNVSGQSTIINVDGHVCEDINIYNTNVWTSTDVSAKLYTFNLSEYQSKPNARFKGCVKADLQTSFGRSYPFHIEKEY